MGGCACARRAHVRVTFMHVTGPDLGGGKRAARLHHPNPINPLPPAPLPYPSAQLIRGSHELALGVMEEQQSVDLLLEAGQVLGFCVFATCVDDSRTCYSTSQVKDDAFDNPEQAAAAAKIANMVGHVFMHSLHNTK